MENTVDIRKKIHEFIDHADERILRIINAIINTEQEEEIIGTEHKKILDQRLKDHADNRDSGKLWIEVKNNLQENTDDKLIIKPEAENDINEAIEWYKEQSEILIG